MHATTNIAAAATAVWEVSAATGSVCVVINLSVLWYQSLICSCIFYTPLISDLVKLIQRQIVGLVSRSGFSALRMRTTSHSLVFNVLKFVYYHQEEEDVTTDNVRIRNEVCMTTLYFYQYCPLTTV